jgi:hypothetical protein
MSKGVNLFKSFVRIALNIRQRHKLNGIWTNMKDI